MAAYDCIVIGGGHNGLVCANLLAQAGRHTLLLEARDHVGGIASGDQLCPGIHEPGPVADASKFRPWIVKALGLEHHGLKRLPSPPSTAVIGDDQRFALSTDLDAAVSSIAAISPVDAIAYRKFQGELDTLRPLLRSFVDRPPIDLVHLEAAPKLPILSRGFGLRRLGRKRMMELLRILPMSAKDWLSGWFESPLLAAAIATPSLAYAFAAPRSPGTVANIVLDAAYDSVGYEGGGPRLIAALESAARGVGVEIRCGAAVTSIEVNDRRAIAVVVDGERVAGTQVVSACCPRSTLQSLLPRAVLPSRTEQRADNLRARGTVAHLSIACDKTFDFGDGLTSAVLVNDLDELERAFDCVKYRECSQYPVLEATIYDETSGLCDGEHSVISVRALHAPPPQSPGEEATARESFEKRILHRLESALPGVSAAILEKKLRLPSDLERDYRLDGGHLAHLEMALDQTLVRPLPECVGYRTPIQSLYLASSGSHPGSGITGLPGALAARSILAASR